MERISFNINGLKIEALVEKRKGPIALKKAFTAKAKCPVCNKELKAGFGLGDFISRSQVISTLKSNMKTHIGNVHKK